MLLIKEYRKKNSALHQHDVFFFCNHCSCHKSIQLFNLALELFKELFVLKEYFLGHTIIKRMFFPTLKKNLFATEFRNKRKITIKFSDTNRN